ncbi:MAG: permease-like cell division protein FtsX [Synechococcales cyanobacterium]
MTLNRPFTTPSALSTFGYKVTYLLHETLLGLRRGGWLNWAAVSTLMVSLFLVGISLNLSWGLDASMRALGNQLQISAYLYPSQTAAAVVPTVSGLEHVAQVQVISKEDAWKQLLIDMGVAERGSVEQQLGANPLVDTLRVQVDDIQFLDQVAATLKRLEPIEEVAYGSQVVKQMNSLQETLRLGSLTVTGVLTLAAVAVITTTIRLIVMARRREIEVMQLVGATAAWIYMPFIVQGFLFGVISALTAWGLILGSQGVINDVFGTVLVLPFLQLSSEQNLTYWLLPLILLGLGTFLGTTGSLIAVQRSSR